jgi:heptosyltransferase-1
MADRRFLIVRLGSLGDIIHTLPASAALRDSFPTAQIDWAVESHWMPVLDGNPDLNSVIPLDRSSTAGVLDSVACLRSAHYTSALDFQSLYKSALLARAAGPHEVLGKCSASIGITRAKARRRFCIPGAAILPVRT